MSEKEKILSRTKDMYMKFGVKSVTMEDVARDLGISKKTLYQYFTDKNELVKTAMEYHLKCDCSIITDLTERTENAIEEMLNLAEYISENLRNLTPTCVYDLQKYYPDCWAMFKKHKHNFIYNIIFKNIKNGIRQGLYRDDLNIDINARFYIGRLEMIADTELFPKKKYDVPTIIKEYILYHIRSVTSKKGMDFLKKIKKRQKSIA